ncbi:MAG: hypothetical protein U9Q97_10090, partial [Acidobacteriota bacterium]|nr:hypothetical protein [Acidobacteriota bacterium]
MSKEIECLFGYHNYIIPWKEDKDVLICENCKRVGHYKNFNGYEMWYAFDEKGNKIYYRNSSGFESRYNENGDMIRYKTSDGYEKWYDGNKWVDEKPKNWRYEKCLKK